MPERLTYTLTTDGTSDTALLPILNWLIREVGFKGVVQAQWAAPVDLRLKQPHHLPSKLVRALDLFPCDLLFVHRDAETASRSHRLSEISRAVSQIPIPHPPYVCVVPVRMQETWLLINEQAIRHAVGNKSGKQMLSLPSVAKLEEIPDAKADLYNLLRTASEFQGRRLKQFNQNITHTAKRVAEFIEDFSTLRQLPAFVALETELTDALKAGKWLP